MIKHLCSTRFWAVAAFAALLFPATSFAQQCIPSCDEKDGRTLAITDGAGLSTLSDETLDITVRVNETEDFFLLGFFDGETGGLWDLPGGTGAAPQQDFTLYADPLGDGSCGGDGCDAADEIAYFDGEAMPDNAWYDENVPNDIRALNPDGDLYVYLLRAELGGTLVAPVRSSFKVRTGTPEQAAIEVFQQPFSFSAAMPGFIELGIIYPGCAGATLPDCLASLDNTTYDGTFSFFIEQIQPQCEFIVWDGDLDHGSFDGVDKDTDDPNVPPGLAGLPPWACQDPLSPCDATFDGSAWVGPNPPLTAINFEGVALGLCVGGPNDGLPCFDDDPGPQPFVPDCPMGTCPITGDPPDNFDAGAFGGLGAIFVRDGSLTYEVWSPACPSTQAGCAPIAVNDNPSGNQEWEYFRLAVPGGGCYLDANGFPPEVDVDELPAGTYEVRVLDLDLENLNAFRFDGRSVSEPCGECKGGVTQLTLEYNGILDPDPIIRAEKDSNTVYFEGPVGTNGRFTIDNGDSSLGDVEIYINGVLNTDIHTSCSQPIFPGLVTGDFTVVSGISKDNGPICVDIGCNECDGGVTDLTFLYEGTLPVELTIYDGTSDDPDKIVFGPTFVDFGDEISITKRPGQDKFSSNISLWVDGAKYGELHTSCSQPIGPGVSVGEFVIVAGDSRNGGELCPLPPDDGCDACDGGITSLNLRNVTGAPVAVEIYDDADAKADKLLFAGTLAVDGETGTLSGTRSDGKFNSNISIWAGGLRVATIHTSCSQPVGVGMVFGGFEVVSGSSRNGGPFCPAACAPAQLDFRVLDDEVKFKILNNGITPLQIQKLVLEWPEGKGALEKIDFDGTIFEQIVPWQPGGVVITDFIGDAKNRALEAGDNHELKLHFTDKTTTGEHFVRVEFNSGCSVEARAGDPGDPGDQCAPCAGGITSLDFRNVTGAPVGVEIYDDNNVNPDKLLFAGTLMDGGETGTLNGTKSDGKFDGDVTIWVGGVKVASIHVSCSQPVGIGMVFGGFEVVSGASKDGGAFCPADCQPSQLDFEVQDDEVRFKILNEGETPLQIQKLVLEWPEAKGDLEKIEFDGTIFESVVPWQASPVEITDFIGDEGNRAVEAGDNNELKLSFSDKTLGGLHSVRVEFNSGCVIEADSDTPPGPTGDFECSKDIDALTMIWQPEASSPAAGQTVYVKAWKDVPGETLLDASGPIAIGAEYMVSGYAPKDGNDVVWEIFGDAGYTNLLGTSVYHLSCSDSEMDGADDCGKRQGDGKGNDSSRLNDWLFEGMVDSDETLDCTP